MIFFEDFEGIKNDQRIGITNLLSNITTREGSHKGGWARLLKCQLVNLGHQDVKILDNKDSLSDFDVIIFDLGAEFSGALNMFGGLDDKVFKRLTQILEFKGRLFSWKHKLPDINVLESRRTNASTCEAFKSTPTSFLGDISRTLETCQTFDHAFRTERLLLGDSHTPSVWTPDLMIERRDGRTLKGMVENDTLQKYYQAFINAGVKLSHIHVHCSSIDIRHHLGRELDPEQATINLADQFINKLMNIGDVFITVNHTMGIEDESRELPKTGYFKGTPYYGSWELRNRLRTIFNTMMDRIVYVDHEAESFKLPSYFFDSYGKLQFEVMERPGSVHISPEHYRWNLDTNKDRWIHEESR